jgi:hypothetical protein
MPNADKIVWYTFAAIVTYLVLTNWGGANALLGTVFGGYKGSVEALQGRSKIK